MLSWVAVGSRGRSQEGCEGEGELTQMASIWELSPAVSFLLYDLTTCGTNCTDQQIAPVPVEHLRQLCRSTLGSTFPLPSVPL